MPLEMTVRDVMRPIDQFAKLQENDALSHASDLLIAALREHKPPCSLIVYTDESGFEVIKGFVTPYDIIFGFVRHFLRGAEKIGPIFWEGQLRTECRKAMQGPIGDIMQPIQIFIRHDEMLMEAIFLFKKYQVDVLPVVSAEDVIGMMLLNDILYAIARISNKNMQDICFE